MGLELGAVLLLAGLALGPVTAVVFALLDDVVPVGGGAEATTWVITAFTGGAAAGAALAGLTREAVGVDAALLLAPGALLVELLVVAAGRARLSPRAARAGAPRPAATEAELRERIEVEQPNLRAEGRFLELAIADAQTDDLLGAVALHAFVWRHARAELGIWLVPGSRGTPSPPGRCGSRSPGRSASSTSPGWRS